MLLRDLCLYDPSAGINGTHVSLRIQNGKIAAILAVDAPADGEPEMDMQGLCAAPGLVDLHVHLREPGATHKEDILSGCRAAAAGGVTSLLCMPNTVPAADTPGVIEYVLEKAKQADAKVYPVGAVTYELNGERLTDFAALKQAGAVAVSDDGRPDEDPELMRTALQTAKENGMLLLAHCEKMALAGGGLVHEGHASRLLGVKGMPRQAEFLSIAEAIEAAEETDCAVHICHVSTEESVQIIAKAQQRGIKVTAETCPQYYSLTEREVLGRDADYRMNPPLREHRDVQAIKQGLKQGVLSVLATDHAPHAVQEKADFDKAPNGVIGMETALAAAITYLVRTGELSLYQVIEKMSTTPARLLGLPAGSLQVGCAADIVIFDPDTAWTVDPNKMHGKSKNAVYKGKTLYGQVVYTLLDGKIVYKKGE